LEVMNEGGRGREEVKQFRIHQRFKMYVREFQT